MPSDAEALAWEGMDEPEPEVAAERALAASALGPLSQRIEGIAGYLVDHPWIEKLTHFRNWDEPLRYARMDYLLAFADSVGHMDDMDEDSGRPRGFRFPDMRERLLKKDYEYRTSTKQGTRRILESITKIFERSGDAPRRGLLGGRR